MVVKTEKFSLLVECLTGLNKKIATMESCTGGLLASSITNIPGASTVMEYGFVTYSNIAKIDMGVSKDIIDKYTVYSKEAAVEMAIKASMKANSNYGVGITGELNSMPTDITYICIYDKDNKKEYNYTLGTSLPNRIDNKIIIVNFIVDKLLSIVIEKED